MISSKRIEFVVLVILDGWGIAPKGPGNAIELASTPNMDRLLGTCPNTQLVASGEAVGLPRGEAGNTETGHLNLGAGMIVYQELERINLAIAEGSFFNNKALLAAINHAKDNKSNLHLMGLLGAGGAHSDIGHLYALISLAKKHDFKNLYLHIFTDGRDSPPTSAKTYLATIKKVMERENVGKIASIMGRYWAMDRDQRWDRTAKAYFALIKGEGEKVKSAEIAIDKSYSKGITDEFIKPTIIVDDNGSPKALISNSDAVVFFNFRVDRPRQLTKAFVSSNFNKAARVFDYDPHQVKRTKTHKGVKAAEPPILFERGEKLKNIYFATMTEYGKALTVEGAVPAFPPVPVDMPIGRVISMNGLRQLRITESEKERFVTYHFNGLRAPAFPQEERIIIPSPDVDTYDKMPEMSSKRLTSTIISKLIEGKYALTVLNYPNADMVSHTGNIKPCVKAVEAVDDCIGKLYHLIVEKNGLLVITADHGNAEEMINLKTNQIDTEHSSNPVPFIAASKSLVGKSYKVQSGILADVAPTILKALRLTIPSGMTGRNLLRGVLQ